MVKVFSVIPGQSSSRSRSSRCKHLKNVDTCERHVKGSSTECLGADMTFRGIDPGITRLSVGTLTRESTRIVECSSQHQISATRQGGAGMG